MSWSDVFSTLSGFGWNYLATLLMAGVVAYLGLFTVLRRIVFTGVALAQVAAAGVGGAFFLADHLPASAARWVSGFGATVASFLLTLLAALGIRVSPSRGRIGGDALVGFIYIVSAALAVLFVWRSSQGLAELREILAGDVLLTRPDELVFLCVALVGVAAVHWKYRKRFLVVSYDPEFARTLGLDVNRIDLLFLATFATAVAFSLRTGGLLLVFAYLVLPGVIGLTLGRRLGEAKILGVSAALAATVGGYLFAIVENLPVAHSISALLGGMTVLAWLVGSKSLASRLVRTACFGGGLASLGLAAWLLPSVVSRGDRSTPPPSGAHHGHSHGAHHHDRDEVEVAVGHLRGDGTDEQKIAAADMIGRVGTPEHLPMLLLAYAEETPDVRLAVGEATRAFVTRRGIEKVRDLTRSDDVELAAQASRVLATLGDPLGPGFLIAVLGRDDAPLLVRDAVLTDLQRVTGQSFGYDSFADPSENAAALEAWSTWWDANRPE